MVHIISPAWAKRFPILPHDHDEVPHLLVVFAHIQLVDENNEQVRDFVVIVW